MLCASLKQNIMIATREEQDFIADNMPKGNGGRDHEADGKSRSRLRKQP